MNIEIVERKAVRIASRRYTGPFGEPLARYWRNTVTPWLADLGLVDCPRYGIALDNPMSTPPDRCRYDACVELPPGLDIPGSKATTLAGGKFAVTRFKGTGADIGAAWFAFVGECGARGLAMDATRPAFEHYPRGSSVDPKTGVFACELCFPVGS